MAHAADWSRELVTVFKDGDTAKVSRLNALELVRYSGYSWQVPQDKVATTTAELVITTVMPVEAVPAPQETLYDEAENVTGIADPRKYLEDTFSKEALRTKLEEDFGIKTGPNTSKTKLVDLYLEADTNKEQEDAE